MRRPLGKGPTTTTTEGHEIIDLKRCFEKKSRIKYTLNVIEKDERVVLHLVGIVYRSKGLESFKR